jgi:uncharacterized DUF497 family protein
VEFEYDPAKSHSNAEKHGIDFEQAQRLWDDPHRISTPADTSKELRFALIAEWDRRAWYAAYTLRGTRVRLISVRRARDNEREKYETQKADR